ncbi:zinc-dependent peptidase [Nonlabens antarcticus]|uniref:zinc-dependent peptidase n=1 Tax=Nonlabens antarcticus TaxID=392714 RepID=UPI001891A461|nr:zinc-dependent peptidase [Nonlabens antarcticus]
MHLLLRYLQNKYDFLWYRQILSWRKLSLSRKLTLESSSFYKKLSSRYKRQFEHRVVCFLKDKQFQHRYAKPILEEQKVLISCIAVMLTFGRRNYLMDQLETILIFDEPFESAANTEKHKGEYNPRAAVLALSWPDVLKGINIKDDNINLALHEFTHVLHIESERAHYIDALRYHKYHQKILLTLLDKDLRINLARSRYFREYAFTNQYEFMAVLTEYYFESPTELKQLFPKLYALISKALLMKEKWVN